MKKKNAIKREQSQVCLSYAEREHFGATLKIYKKPEMQEYKLQSHAQILAGSYPPNWGGPIGYAPNIGEDDKPIMA